MTKKVFILSAMLAGSISCLQAQTQMLTLDEVFKLADENSKSINIHSLMTDEAEKAIEIAKNDLLPSVGAKATAQYISDCVTFDRDFGNWEVEKCHISAIHSSLKLHRLYTPEEE